MYLPSPKGFFGISDSGKLYSGSVFCVDVPEPPVDANSDSEGGRLAVILMKGVVVWWYAGRSWKERES